MIKKIAALSVAIAIIGALLTKFLGSNQMSLSALVVHLLLILNLVGLWVMWRMVFQKKSIALGVVVIILKYPLLGYLVLQISRQSWFDSVGVIIGLSLFVVSIVCATLFKPEFKN